MTGRTLSETLFGVIRRRRSIRRYTGESVGDPVLEQLVEAAMWAPSAHNRQPWRFVIVRTPAVLQGLALAMGEQLAQDLSADGVAEDVIRADVKRSYDRITGAAAGIVLCMTLADMDQYPDARRMEAERLMAAQSVALAGQNLLLMAEATGLGSCWMCAPLFCPDVVRGVLDLESHWEPQALITLGYPAESRDKARAVLSTKVLWR